MENSSALQLPTSSSARNRLPLAENLILGDGSNPPIKNRTFSVLDSKQQGENSWVFSTPAATTGKVNSGRHSHGTPPWTRKRAKRRLLPSSSVNEIQTNRLHASTANYELNDHDPHTAFKSTLFHSHSPSLNSSQHAKLAVLSSENAGSESDQELQRDHNVQVMVRIRPFNNAETDATGTGTCLKQESPHVLTWLGQPETKFTFDHVACASTSQDELFQVAGLPMVENCVNGYNSTIFAYGQTGSGKTYTMLGDIEALDRSLNSGCGITPRIFEYLFTRMKMELETSKKDNLKFTCKCSFLEIYNEQITDLLEPSSNNLQIHESPKSGVFVENLKEVEVKNVDDVVDLLLQGAANRHVAQTRENQESSRSHSVFTCVVESQYVSELVTSFRYGRLNLVDLAGSERQKASGAEGERLREAVNINKSLSTLGLVIMSLVDVAQGKQRHIPYRDSKLTFLLQDSLGGNSKTTIIATVSPAISCANETLSTLKFAQRAKFIQNNAIVNEGVSGDVKVLQLQIQDLKKELEQLQSRTQASKCMEPTTMIGTKATEILDNRSRISQNMEQVPNVSTERTLQDNNELAAVYEQLNQLVEAYERDLEYTRTLLQLKEDKIHRLHRVEDTVLSAENCLREENRALRQELCLLKERMDKHPELLRFAFENKRLIQQLRSQDESHRQERELLEAKLANLQKQSFAHLSASYASPPCSRGGTLKSEHIDTDFLMEGASRVDQEEANQMNIYDTIKDGTEALDEALCQIESMKNPFENNEVQEGLQPLLDGPFESDDRIMFALQQAFEIAKDIENEFSILCHIAAGENKRKRSPPLKKMLVRGKRMRVVQPDINKGEVDEADVHVGITNEQMNEAPPTSDPSCLIELQRSVKADIKDIEEPQVGYQELLQGIESSDRDAHAMLYKAENKRKPHIHSYSIVQSKLALAMVQEILGWERNMSKNNLDESYLEQVQKHLVRIQSQLQLENQGLDSLNILNRKLKKEKRCLASENIRLTQEIKKLQSDLMAREREIAALQEEKTVVTKEGLMANRFGITRQFEGCENQRTQVEHVYKQTMYEIKDTQNQIRFKLQKLIDEIKEGNHKFITIRKRMEAILSNLQKVESTKEMVADGDLDSFTCLDNIKSDAESIKRELDQAYKLSMRMEKKFVVTEREISDAVAVLERWLGEVEHIWEEERARIIIELDQARLHAAERMGEANETLERFKHGHLIIKEAEQMVNTLTKAMESAREQHLDLMKQWDEDRRNMFTEIAELKSLIAQKEDELQRKDKDLQQMLSDIERSKVLANSGVYEFHQSDDEIVRSHLPLNTRAVHSNSWICTVKHDLFTSQNIEVLANTRLHIHDSSEAADSTGHSNIVKTISSKVPLALERYDEGTNLLLEKLEGIVATLSHKEGGEDAWVRFLSSFALALSKLEEEANSCLSFSNVICETLDKTLAEKENLQEELKRKQELLKGSFFDLSLLQESTADYLNLKNKLLSLQEEFDMKAEKLRCAETENAVLENEVFNSKEKVASLERCIVELEELKASVSKENGEMKCNIRNARERISSLEAMLEEKDEKSRKLELELSAINILIEQEYTCSFDTAEQGINLIIAEKTKLQNMVSSLEKQLDIIKEAADTSKRISEEAQETIEVSMRCIQEKTREIKILESSIQELEDTINALESQIEILRRDAELQQLSREDLEMEFQALRHHSMNSKDNTQVKHSSELIMSLKKELAEKSSEIESLKLQVKELTVAAEVQASAHRQRLLSLEAMAENLNIERVDMRMLSPASKKPAEKNAGKRSTSPFKCISSGLAQQINSEKDEELYLNKCRIDELQDLAASRQKEIFRLNKKLAEVEAITYDVMKDLLGVKSDIMNHVDLKDTTKELSVLVKQTMNKEELEALRNIYTEEKISWSEERRRRQAEVIATRFAMEKTRQKNFLLKGENKRLRVDISKLKKRLLRLQEKLEEYCGAGQGHREHLQEVRRSWTFINHIDDKGRRLASVER
ncbi:hypothetical protein KP509_33G001100 [Ceratopteris richardii]|uniref:Kinesin motor domain-containing protein n=4 Tax=Ceratopteris richardii TaxID=49495 RepID=A0A8T2QM40_CERRI|nr:hypothetical protein KP509_33G001100 [Ceratopteris richardii]